MLDMKHLFGKHMYGEQVFVHTVHNTEHTFDYNIYLIFGGKYGKKPHKQTTTDS
jgi:hypothetical protein